MARLTNMKYPADMDPECVKLCDSLNALPGIVTTESCCGHGTDMFQVFFDCTSFESLRNIASMIDGMQWTIRAGHLERLYFVLEGPPGAYDDANSIADLLSRT